MNTVIVDYGSGNLHSAFKAFSLVAKQAQQGTVAVSDSPEAILKAERIVLPGVGAFADCLKRLHGQQGLYETLKEAVIDRGRPFLGICVGMQLMADRGMEHGDHEGFGWIAGRVESIQPSEFECKIPHMGWNELEFDSKHVAFDGFRGGEHMYFVHSYHFVVENLKSRIAHVNYGETLTASVARDNMLGVQFHPEKSAATGLRFIANFLGWRP